MLDAPLKIPQSLKFLQQSIFLKNTLRQGIQDTPKRRGNLIPFLCFNKAHLIEGLRIGGNSGQSVVLDILARFLREFQQFTPAAAGICSAPSQPRKGLSRFWASHSAFLGFVIHKSKPSARFF